jgi:hypothetical protein
MPISIFQKKRNKRRSLLLVFGILAPLSVLWAKTYYVAANGNNANSGLAIDTPLATIPVAIAKMTAGDTIYVRGGRYVCASQITISSSSTDAIKRNCLFAFPGERPFLDFSSIGTPGVSGSSDGIRLTGKYWHIRGFDIKGAPHNGIAISGGWYDLIEFCAVYENRNTGLQLSGGASYNRIINCDAYYNRDSTSSGYDGDADGFAPKLNVGSYNYFYGCRAWQNSDDGWDGYLRPADDVTDTLENCWSFMNGYLKSGTESTGNGNGFKMGGGDKVNGVSNGDSLRHNMILKNCLCFDNRAKGFDQNNNRGSMTLLNCTGYRNGLYNFSVPGYIRSGETLMVKNCISLAGLGVTFSGVPDAILETDSWLAPFTGAAAADFITLDTTGVRGPRKADGSLPDVSFMHLASGSQFIDAGTIVGLPFYGIRPDLGCFESGGSVDVTADETARLTDFELFQNYPNPFNPTTIISYQLSEVSNVRLEIYDILGREVGNLVNEQQEPGYYQKTFNARSYASGMYVYQLSLADRQNHKYIFRRKMIILK